MYLKSKQYRTNIYIADKPKSVYYQINVKKMKGDKYLRGGQQNEYIGPVLTVEQNQYGITCI